MKANFSATVVSALALFSLHAIGAAPIKASIEEGGNLYQFANQCYLMKLYDSDHYLSKTDNGFVFSQFSKKIFCNKNLHAACCPWCLPAL